MLTPFNKIWIGATCAPESIKTVDLNDLFWVHIISNEDRSLACYVFESKKTELIMAITVIVNVLPEDIKSYSFDDAINTIVKLLDLRSITVK